MEEIMMFLHWDNIITRLYLFPGFSKHLISFLNHSTLEWNLSRGGVWNKLEIEGGSKE